MPWPQSLLRLSLLKTNGQEEGPACSGATLSVYGEPLVSLRASEMMAQGRGLLLSGHLALVTKEMKPLTLSTHPPPPKNLILAQLTQPSHSRGGCLLHTDPLSCRSFHKLSHRPPDQFQPNSPSRPDRFPHRTGERETGASQKGGGVGPKSSGAFRVQGRDQDRWRTYYVSGFQRVAGGDLRRPESRGKGAAGGLCIRSELPSGTRAPVTCSPFPFSCFGRSSPAPSSGHGPNIPLSCLCAFVQNNSARFLL